MDTKNPIHLTYVATLPCETLMLAKQAINDKLQASVVFIQIKRGFLLTVWVNFFKSMNIWKSYKQERDCLVHFAHLANTLLKDEESARDNHVLACNFATYLPI